MRCQTACPTFTGFSWWGVRSGSRKATSYQYWNFYSILEEPPFEFCCNPNQAGMCFQASHRGVGVTWILPLPEGKLQPHLISRGCIPKHKALNRPINLSLAASIKGSPRLLATLCLLHDLCPFVCVCDLQRQETSGSPEMGHRKETEPLRPGVRKRCRFPEAGSRPHLKTYLKT